MARNESDPRKPRSNIWILLSIFLLAAALLIWNSNQTVVEDSSANLPSTVARTVSHSEEVANADLAVLFVGNSHTTTHDLPQMVMALLKHHSPEKKSCVGCVGVGFLEHALGNPMLRAELESGDWDVVVLQAQEISQSGKHRYSKAGAIEVANLAKKHGAKVFFFAEWGMKGRPDNTKHTEEIYQELATETNAQLIPVGRVWEAVLSKHPNWNLHDGDGNHQALLGATLTSNIIASALLDQPSTGFHSFRPPGSTADQWKAFCDITAETLR